jgi:hypothetical protein
VANLGKKIVVPSKSEVMHLTRGSGGWRSASDRHYFFTLQSLLYVVDFLSALKRIYRDFLELMASVGHFKI